MSKFVAWFAARRKALVPFVPAVILLSNYYLGVQPAASLSSGAVWATVIGLALTALGVHTVGNDGAQAPVAAPK